MNDEIIELIDFEYIESILIQDILFDNEMTKDFKELYYFLNHFSNINWWDIMYDYHCYCVDFEQGNKEEAIAIIRNYSHMTPLEFKNEVHYDWHMGTEEEGLMELTMITLIS